MFTSDDTLKRPGTDRSASTVGLASGEFVSQLGQHRPRLPVEGRPLESSREHDHRFGIAVDAHGYPLHGSPVGRR